ncbi:MAG: hypothetical protein V4543_14245 [Bacteroidota bacterium]
MSKSEERLIHALHNEKVCKYLDKKPEHSDWVITSAFYASLHFVSYLLFPLKVKAGENVTEYVSINAYYPVFNRTSIFKLSLHSLLCHLLEKNHQEIADDYALLLDYSKQSRYLNHQFDREVSNAAKRRLERIKEYCLKN